MATHYGGTGQPLDRDPIPHEQVNDILSNHHHEDTDNFENVEHDNHTTLKVLTRNPDDLWHRVETAKGQPMEAINHLECELHRLSLMLWSSAPPEPLDDVLQQYTETLCSSQSRLHLQIHWLRIYPPSIEMIQCSKRIGWYILRPQPTWQMKVGLN